LAALPLKTFRSEQLALIRFL